MDWLIFYFVVTVLTAKGLEINTTSNQIVAKAKGQTVKLDCQFTTTQEDVGNLEIEWAVKSIRHPMEKVQVLWYTAGNIYDGRYEPLKGRVYFQSEDPANGDAAIVLLLLTYSDTGIYYCQVKKMPGLQTIKTVLRVLVPPSKPTCYSTEGTGEAGKTRVLHCGSKAGAPPTWYSWTREPPGTKLSASSVMDQTAGTLTIQDVSDDDEGTYKCTARNRVGEEECFLELNLKRPQLVGIISGAVIGSLVFFGIVSAVVYFVRRKRGNSEPETSNEILEDASPPTRRSGRSRSIIVASPRTPM